MSKLLQTAFQEFGQKEISGPEHNEHIVNYAREAGFTFINDDETPWCSIFVNWCCYKNDLERSEKANARSWLETGDKTTNPQPGDVVVFWRESIHSWKGHVGFFLGFNHDKNKVFCLGGNQHDSVNISAYDTGKVLGYRRLEKEHLGGLPDGILKINDRGDKVIILQKALNKLDSPCGDPDGIFGPITQDALKTFQANHGLEIDGVYGPNTRNKMQSLLQE